MTDKLVTEQTSPETARTVTHLFTTLKASQAVRT